MFRKIVGLEEHFITADVLDAWRTSDPQFRDLSLTPSTEGDSARRLADLGEERLSEMAKAGIDVQVLSLSTPGVQNLDPAEAIALQIAANDVLADAVANRPEQFQGLATLATPRPPAAAAELERAVTVLGLDGAMVFGRTRDRNMDELEFWPIYEAAAALRAPLHLHPQTPPLPVRQAYYSGFGAPLDAAFATHGLGWHNESGIQVLRLIFSGVFDRFPDLQVIVGHWGELVAFYLDRIDSMNGVARLQRPVSEYFGTNVYLAPSGVLSQRYLRWHQRQPRSEILWFASLPSLWAVVAGWIGYTWAPTGDAWVPVMFSAISIVGWPLATATRFIRFTGWRARNSPWDGPKLLGFGVAQLVLYTTVVMMPSHAPLAYRLGTGAAVIPAAMLIGGLCQSAASRRKRARSSPKES